MTPNTDTFHAVTAFTFYSAFDKGTSQPFNLSKSEFEPLIEKKNNLVIQKADTGNTIAILDKDSYSKSIETLLKDSSKFKNILVALDKDLKYVINSEKRVTDLLKKSLKTRTQSVKEPIINKGQLIQNRGHFMDQLKSLNTPKVNYQHPDTLFYFSDWYP